jgi:ribosomal protein S18 acetylase RimI-like enzyme
MPKYREATIADLNQMLSWRGQSQAAQEAITREFDSLETGKSIIFLAFEAKQLIGTVQLSYDHTDPEMIRNAVYLQALEVHGAFRRQGIATALCQLLETKAAQKGYSRITVEIEPDNSPSIRFFQKHDYLEFKQSEFIWDGEILPVICFEKNIK